MADRAAIFSGRRAICAARYKVRPPFADFGVRRFIAAFCPCRLDAWPIIGKSFRQNTSRQHGKPKAAINRRTPKEPPHFRDERTLRAEKSAFVRERRKGRAQLSVTGRDTLSIIMPFTLLGGWGGRQRNSPHDGERGILLRFWVHRSEKSDRRRASLGCLRGVYAPSRRSR